MTQRFGFCCKWLNDTSEFGGMKVNVRTGNSTAEVQPCVGFVNTRTKQSKDSGTS